jgi:hypothetical protein
MTADQYREFSNSDQEQFFMYLDSIEFEIPDHVNEFQTSMLSVDWYYDQRLKEREKRPEIAWPVNLSKKEKIICKLKMVQNLLEYLYQSYNVEVENLKIIEMLIKFIKSVISEVHSQDRMSRQDGRIGQFLGIQKDVAKVINAIYTKLIKCFQQKFSV